MHARPAASPPAHEEKTGWSKRGLLVSTPTEHAWSSSHAALPAVLTSGERRAPVSGDSRAPASDDSRALVGDEGRAPVGGGSRAALYYSPRDERGRAHVARACLQSEANGELVVQGHDPEPVLRPGTLGTFDDSGVTMSCVVRGDGATFLYYTGWTLGVTVPFYFYAGLAIQPDGQASFARVSQAPILERDAVDPYLTASPWVINESGGWRMWYVSCSGWEMVGGAPRHYYHLRYAESPDGVHWQREGRVAIDFADEREYAISRPCVIHDGDRYRMWFAARGEYYRMGYAESWDGFTWDRDDSLAGVEPSPTGWDSEMVAYPAVFDLAGVRYMLYNGNSYGRSGIGYAIWRGGE